MGLLWRAGAAHRIDHDEVVAPFGQRAHEEHHGVHEPPRDIAPDHSDEQLTHVVATGGGCAERPCEGQRHDQPEQDLGHPRDRVQETLRLARVGGRAISISAILSTRQRFRASRGQHGYVSPRISAT